MQEQTQQPEYVFKIILIGNSSAGKSSLVQYFIKQQAKTNISQTVGVEFASKNVMCKGKLIKLQIWDTAGQEKFRSIARTYFKQTIGALVVFDLTSQSSFEAIEDWISEARENGRENLDIIVVGNKTDLVDLRQIEKITAEQQIKSKDALYEETSALTGEKVEEAFMKLVECILQKVQNGQIDQDEYNPKFKNPLLAKKTETKEPDQRCQYC